MHQGPHCTFYSLIKQALEKNDIESAIESIHCCSPVNAREIYDLIFKDLFNGSFYYLKDIKALKPTLWLAFLKRNELCSKIGAKKLGKILRKIIPILQKLQSELPYVPQVANLLSTYNDIFCLIATNKEFLEGLVKIKHLLKVEDKEFIISHLQTMTNIDDQVLFFYENDEDELNFTGSEYDEQEDKEDQADEADEYIFTPSQNYADDEDSFEPNGKRGPTFEELQDPNLRRRTPFVKFLKSSYTDDRIKDFILLNQGDFLLSLDPASIDTYIFKNALFSNQEKLVILKVLIKTLECKDKLKQERAKNCLTYLLSKNNEVRQLFSHDLSNTLNTQALLLLSVCTVAALEPQAQTTEKMLETMKACFVPLGRAMRDCLVKGNVHDITNFFKDHQHLEKLCSLYSYCAQEECHQAWNSFWALNNATGDYQVIFNTCLNHYPHFLYRKALSHLSLGKNDEVNQKLAKDYLKEAIQCEYLPAHLALAAIYAKKNNHKLMMVNFEKFIHSQKSNQELPNKESISYRFLFEIYYTYVRHISSQFDKIQDEFNRVYPGLIEKFERTMCQALMVKKPEIVGNDLRDPIAMLRMRFRLLRVNAKASARVNNMQAPAPTLVFTEQPTPPFIPQNVPYYFAPPIHEAAPHPASSLPMPGSPTGGKKEN